MSKPTRRFESPVDHANHLFQQYLIHSYRYYVMDDPIIPDTAYDQLCQQLLVEWLFVDHPDKSLTDSDALRAGTGYQLQFKYPPWVIDMAINLRN
jgi:DNA ligase (NAD+)